MCVMTGLAALGSMIGGVTGAVSGGSGILSTLGTVASIAGTAVSGIATMQSQKAQEQQEKNNAIIAQRNADDARARGVVDEQENQLRTRAMIGKQNNMLSERGFDVGKSSALQLIGDTAMFGKMDDLNIRRNSELEAIGFETQKMNHLGNAQQAKNAASASLFGTGASMFSTALGGFSSMQKRKLTL